MVAAAGGYLSSMAMRGSSTTAAPSPVVVEPRPDGRWAVQRDRSKRAVKLFDTQSSAERRARTMAQNQGAELVVKDRTGRIARRDTHGRDRADRPG